MKRILYVVLITSLVFQQSHSQGKWTQKASLPVGKERAVAFSIGNFGYIGTGGNGFYTKDFWKYDPQSDTWEEMASMPTLGRLGAMSFAINGKGYVGGGVNGNELVDNEFWEYDPQLNNWSKKGNLPTYPGSYSTMTTFAIAENGYLLTTYHTDNFWEYSPANDTWTKRANFPGAGNMEQVGFAIGTKGYIGTGFGGGLNSTPEFWQYDTEQDKWFKKADFPGTPRMSAVGFSINKSGFLGLGVSNGGVFHNDFWEYHPETDSWNQIEDCGYYAADAVAMSIGSKGYVGTGLFDGSAFWEYTPDLSSVNTIEQSQKVDIYPNPVRDRLFFDIDFSESMTFSIYSVLGQIVKIGAATGRSISVADLPEGVYVLKILSTKPVLSKEFIKEK